MFIIWTRIIRADGLSVMINSPGTDPLGRAGLEGEVDTHFFQIFGAAILLSILDGGIDVAVEMARQQGDDSTAIIQRDRGMSRAAELAQVFALRKGCEDAGATKAFTFHRMIPESRRMRRIAERVEAAFGGPDSGATLFREADSRERL